MKSEKTFRVGIALCQAVLLTAIGLSGWTIYSELPSGEVPGGVARRSDLAQTLLEVRLSNRLKHGVSPDVTLEILPVDIAEIERDFRQEPQRDIKIQDALKLRTRAEGGVSTTLDSNGFASVRLAPGKWWIYSTLEAEETIEWRLPVNVIGRRLTVELTPENAYARMKKF